MTPNSICINEKIMVLYTQGYYMLVNSHAYFTYTYGKININTEIKACTQEMDRSERHSQSQLGYLVKYNLSRNVYKI